MPREELGFTAAALRSFDFLVRDYGFRCSKQSPSLVRFDSTAVFIEIFHGLKDYEVGIHFGRVDDNKRLSFGLYMRRFCPEVHRALGDRLADTVEQVETALHGLAEALVTCGKPIIDGEAQMFEEMTEVRWWDFCPEVLRPPEEK